MIRGNVVVLVAAAVSAAALVIAALVALDRDGSEPHAPARDALLASDPGPVHVHGLGVDPADSSLLIATHTGLYRVGAGDKQASRVGASRQDTMGFTVVGPNRFLGSGHPDLEEARARGLPPHLGLIESRDAGRSWRPISLLGEADFHVLRVAGRRVYGYDASNDRLLVSRDGGTSWRRIDHPAPLIDLAADPRDPHRLVVSAVDGLHRSTNEGRRWERLGPARGLLAWPSAGRLVLVDASGVVRSSADAGRRWRRVGEVGGEPAALLAQTQAELYVALHDGTIKRSLDGGRTWSVRSAP